MKPVISVLFFSTVLLSSAAFAQHNVSSQKATASSERLSAQAYYENLSSGPLALVDSAHYSYGDIRGSRFDYNNLRYTDLTLLGSQPIADFLNLTIPTNNIDSSSYPNVDFDSADVLLNIGATAPPPQRVAEAHLYNADNTYDQVASRIFDNTGTQQYGQRTANVYTAGKLTRVYVRNYNGNTYDTSFIRDLAYDPSGRIILDSISAKLSTTFTAWSKDIYTYGTGTGFLTSTHSFYRPSPPGLDLRSRVTNTYYPGGLVKSSYYQTYYQGSASFKPGGLDSFGYASGTAGHTYMRQIILDTTGKAQYTYFTLAAHINSSGQKDSVTFLGYQDTVFLGGGSTAITYNSNNNPSERKEYNLNLNLISAQYAKELYYYEPIPAAGIAASSHITNDPIVVYPNPTSGIISLRLPVSLIGKALSVQINDVAGRLARTEVFVARNIDETITLGNEAIPGQYIISIRDNSGTVLYSGRLLKK